MEIKRQTTTILKAIAIIAVVSGHLGLIHRGGAIGVSIVLVISGYGLTKSWDKNTGVLFWKKRLTSVWVPYFLWTVLLISVCTLFGKYRLNGMKTTDYVLTLLGLHPTPILDPTMWYIPYIFLCYALLFAVYSIFRGTRERIIGIVFANIVGGV